MADADMQLTLSAPALKPHILKHLLRAVQQALGALQQQLPGWRQKHAVCPAQEELNAYFRLQIADDLGEGLAGEKEGPGCFGDAALLTDLHETLKLF